MKAKQIGACVLMLRNAHHIGRAGHYTEQAAAAGCTAVHFVNAAGHPSLVAPYGGADARVATNPFSVAVPTGPDFPSAVLGDGKPMSLDFATSIVANGSAPSARPRARSFSTREPLSSEPTRALLSKSQSKDRSL